MLYRDTNLDDDLYDINTRSACKKVRESYKNLNKTELKFTQTMISLIKIDLIEHCDCTQAQLEKLDDLSPVTKTYIKKCKSELKNYNIIDITENLTKLNLL